MSASATVDLSTVNQIHGRPRLRRVLRADTARRALLAACALVLCAPAAAVAGSVAPPLASEYQSRHVCSGPAPGRVGCLAMMLVPKTAAARARERPLAIAHGASPGMVAKATECPAAYAASCLTPIDLNDAYFSGEPPDAPASEPQTIALVDAYDDPNAEADLEVYDHEFGLLPCTEANSCFEKVNQLGETGHPPSAGSKQAKEEASGWALEISTDIEVAHAVCQNCHIRLVEANSAAYPNLEAAEETAVKLLHATEVSNSWGGEEPPIESLAFEHPGTVITAAAGDDGYLNWTEAEAAKANNESYYAGADYPASSPHVVAVGGTELTLAAGARQSETVWNEDHAPAGENYGAGGGGCSTQFPAPEWQQQVPDWSSVGCGTKRADADVAADGDPYTGVDVYDSVPYEGQVLGWVPIGGTSVASPIVASVFALAGGAHGVKYPAATLYSRLSTPSLFDVTAGGNGKCDGLYTGCSGSMEPLSLFDCGEGKLICNAAPGYDGPTGVGAPNGLAAFEPGSEAEHATRAEGRKEGAKQAAEALKAEEAKQAAKEKQTLEEQEKAEEKRKTEERKAEELNAKEAQRKLEEEANAAAARKAAEERKAAEQKTSEEAARAGSGGDSGANQLTAGAGDLGATGLEEAEPSEAASSKGSGSAKAHVRLTGLALTARASATIARGLPTLSQVAFAFTLSAPARVWATLSRRVLVRGRPRWVAAPGALTFAAGGGRRHAHLQGHGTLASGRYRLTLTPAHGRAQSLVFVLR
jgi:Subtilase family